MEKMMKELDEIFGEIKPSAKLDEIISEIKSSAKLDDEHTVLIAFGYDDEPEGWRSVRITPDGYSYDDRAFWQENVKVGQSFEEACEAAIKYCLTNLIINL